MPLVLWDAEPEQQIKQVSHHHHRPAVCLSIDRSQVDKIECGKGEAHGFCRDLICRWGDNNKKVQSFLRETHSDVVAASGAISGNIILSSSSCVLMAIHIKHNPGLDWTADSGILI